jgi:hypothetical protein
MSTVRISALDIHPHNLNIENQIRVHKIRLSGLKKSILR